VLISGLNVHLHQHQPATRARWAQHLVRKAAEWQVAGYVWLSKQAFWLAHELSSEYCQQEWSAMA
jgi:hypothetical protein